jgi:suppressor for copper-sensitivity B
MKSARPSGCLFRFLLVSLCLVATTRAQEPQAPFAPHEGGGAAGNFTDLLQPEDPSATSGTGQDLVLSGALKLRADSREGILQVHASMANDWHIYALSQKGGPGPSSITVQSADKIELLGSFQPDEAPEVREVAEFDVPLEEHYGEVTWTVPIRLAEGVDPQKVVLDVLFDGILCHDEKGCVPAMDVPVDVRFEGILDTEQAETAIPKTGEFRADRSHVTIRGHVQPASVQPGGALQLVLTAVCDEDWHIYAYAAEDPNEVAKPTLVVLTEPSGWTLGEVQVSEEPIVKQDGDQPPVAYHGGTVSWTFDIQVPETTAVGTVQLAGMIGYQTCTDTSCDRPLAAEFRVDAVIAEQAVEGSLPLVFSPTGYSTVARAAEARQDAVEVADSDGADVADSANAADLRQIDFWAVTFERLGFRETDGQWAHVRMPTVILNAYVLTALAVAMALLVSFLGGLILNIMPCVLPVIGLKLMAFVQQAGEDRWRIFSLNVWYSLGLWLVFLIFATVAAVLHVLGQTFAWGEHLGDPMFSIPLLLLVFTLGLSMFGVWEIPIPGFVGGGKANELAMKEGPAGAFFKGVLTTILATPCSGPFIGVAVGIAVIAPIWLNFAMFTAMALGMASPYLIIGAFPRLIRWLPKPGEWMNTMKEFMGFILMGTGVWILYFLERRFMIPVLSLLVGIAATCWIIGGTSITATRMKRVRNWGWGLLFSLVGFWLFLALLPPPSDLVAERRTVDENSPELPWEAYTPDRLQQYRQEGRTVLVDFTADWCLTCKTNEAVALNTFDTKRRVLDNQVVTLKADKTHRRTSQEVNQLLVELGNFGQTVPFLAIYPAGSDEPILLDGLVTKDQVLSALDRAGPSRSVVDDSDA